jgi:hypothetical protein
VFNPQYHKNKKNLKKGKTEGGRGKGRVGKEGRKEEEINTKVRCGSTFKEEGS